MGLLALARPQLQRSLAAGTRLQGFSSQEIEQMMASVQVMSSYPTLLNQGMQYQMSWHFQSWRIIQLPSTSDVVQIPLLGN
jgi:hypothetical protein